MPFCPKPRGSFAVATALMTAELGVVNLMLNYFFGHSREPQPTHNSGTGKLQNNGNELRAPCAQVFTQRSRGERGIHHFRARYGGSEAPLKPLSSLSALARVVGLGRRDPAPRGALWSSRPGRPSAACTCAPASARRQLPAVHNHADKNQALRHGASRNRTSETRCGRRFT